MSRLIDALRGRPPGFLALRAIQEVKRRGADLVRRPRAERRGTFGRDVPGEGTRRYFRWDPAWFSERERRSLVRRCRRYLDHRFDLLGSGWVPVGYGATPEGVEGIRYDSPAPEPNPDGEWLASRVAPGNLAEARRLWRLIPADYEPIDWQRDVKSGYRWSERAWHRSIRVAPVRGADIKVPWELARMHHLPHLAQAFSDGSEKRYLEEFRSQVLDFMATNPPGYGVNWRCAMDVAVRLANWLVAYDLFAASGGSFDPRFREAFWRSVREHGRHIAGNLEGVPGYRGNHYLADLGGLLFAGAYLPSCDEVDGWLRFAASAMVETVEEQFGGDGGYFEASVCYHRLATEIALYSTVLILALPDEKRSRVPALEEGAHRLLERLERAAEFTMAVSRGDGRAAQVGDNDSGRWLKMRPTREGADREDPLDHGHLVAAVNGWFGRADFDEFASGWEAETAFVRAAVEGSPGRSTSRRVPGPRGSSRTSDLGHEREWSRWKEAFENAFDSRSVAIRPGKSVLNPPPRRHAFPEFGLFVFRSERLHLWIRCGPIGHHGIGAHAHNDQLSVGLSVDGEEWIVDPGTYLYTPLPERRNEYRSIRAHFAPQFAAGEPDVLRRGCFSMRGAPEGKAVYFGERGFIGEVPEGSARIVLEEDRIVLQSIGAPYPDRPLPIRFSPGYGEREPGSRSFAPEGAFRRLC